MATQVTNYQCPACTGPLHFAGDSGALECDFCGGSYSVEEIEEIYVQKEAEVAGDSGEWKAPESHSWGGDEANMRSYSCPSCGAELICEASTAATACPYCGNPTIVPGQFKGSLKPDYVVPFVLTKKQAEEALKAHYKGKFLLPKVFALQNQIEKIQGVYVPFWLFDAEAEGWADFEATRSSTYTQGDYRVTETDHYRVHRAGSMSFEKVPVDASEKMPDDYMDSVEPYDYSKLQEFSTAYLPGFLADRFDVSAEDCVSRADSRCRQSLLDSLKASVGGYDGVTLLDSRVGLRRGRVSYALMPVWLLSTRWRDESYLFAINGQTGKTVGSLPADKGKFWGLFAGCALALGTVASLIIAAFM